MSALGLKRRLGDRGDQNMGEPLGSTDCWELCPTNCWPMQSAGRCTPERIKADEEMLASIVQVTEWRRDGDAIMLIGPATMKFRPATN